MTLFFTPKILLTSRGTKPTEINDNDQRNIMKHTLTNAQAITILLNDSEASWSYRGARALVEFLEQFEADYDEEIEFDHVELRCEYEEFKDVQEWAEFFFTEQELFEVTEDASTEEEAEQALCDRIQSEGYLIEFEGGVIISSM